MAKKSKKTDNQEEIKDQQLNEEVLDQNEPEVEEQEEQEEVVEEKSKEEELSEKVAEFQDKYLRLTAEFDNYRKRTLREKTELLSSAKEEALVSLLPVIDDMERALESIEAAKDLEAVKEGVKLIHSKFGSYMTQQGIQEIEALNSEFDTDQHEAITKIPVEDKKKKGKVVDVVQKGYKLKDKVIRFAKVVIGE